MAGCLCAKRIAELGGKVLVLEEDGEPGKQGKCTGIVSKKGLDSTGVGYETSVLNNIHGANIRSKNSGFSVRTDEVQACVIDRFAFDEQCALEAERAGAELLYGERVNGIKKSGEKFQITTNKKNNYLGQALVGADGAASFVARELDFPRIAAEDFVLCYEAEYENCFVDDTAMVDVFLDQQLAVFLV